MRTRLNAVHRRVAMVVSGVMVAAGMVLAGPAQSASASFTWPANAWGECNTAKPYGAGYSTLYTQPVSRPAGRPANYYYASCFYWGWTGRWWVPVYTAVDWNRACAIDAYSWYYYQVRPDYSVWCVGP